MGRILHRPIKSLLRRTSPFLILLFSSCATIGNVRTPEKGSLDNPVCTDNVQNQRLYLKRLRTVDGLSIEYEREPPVMGPARQILDPFIVWPVQSGPFQDIELLFRNRDPAHPDEYLKQRLYFIVSSAGCHESSTPPGFTLAESAE